MIDLHSHILPGLDDGARTIEESRDIARRAVAEGTTAIAATPHVRDDYPTTPDEMEQGVAGLRHDFAGAGIAVEVLHGGEIDLERLAEMSPDELRRFTLGQTGRYLLVEFPYYGWPLGLEQRIFELRAARITPILAHPERNQDVQRDPARVAEPVRLGALVQITAASLDGRLGRPSKGTAERLLELGLAHVLASDAHTPGIREAGLAAAVKAVGDEGLAQFLTEDAPAAIAAGEPIPEPPTSSGRRRRFIVF